MSLAEALGASPRTETLLSGESRRFGIDIAQITNIKDPDKLGRVRCKQLSEHPGVAETDWCYCMTPYGGNAYGMFFFPNVGDLVYLAYLGGEITNPVVIGSVWAGKTAAPYKIEDGKNEVASVKTPKGIEIRLDDTDGKQKLTLKTPTGAQICIDDEKKTLRFRGKDENNALTLEWEAGEITLKAQKKLTLAAGNTTITLESSGNIELKSSSEIKTDTANIDLKAASTIKASGTTAEIKATGQLTLQGSGMAQLKGGIVKIN
jgi:uncharacterized protein involved in type VI secretion and phage assembly